MKKGFPIVVMLMFLITGLAEAQAPQLLNYQAVVRSANGTPVAGNTPVRLKFIIHEGSAAGTPVFTETQSTLANEFGLVNVRIGDSVGLGLNWSGSAEYLEVAADINHSGTFTSLGTSQLVSVPYALAAGNGINAMGTDGYLAMFAPGGITNSIISDDGTRTTVNGSNFQSLWIKSTASVNCAVLADAQGPFGYVGSYTDSVSLDVGTTQGNTTGNLNLVTNLYPRLSINGTGQVGIATAATTSHQVTLAGDLLVENYVNGDADVVLSNYPGDLCGLMADTSYFYLNAPATSSALGMGVYLNRYYHSFEPYDDGRTDIGSPSYRWSALWAASGVIQTSDERLKKNVSGLKMGLAEIMKLNPVSYQWKNAKDGGGENIGFIAQEVEKVIPQAVIHSYITDKEIEQAVAVGKPAPELKDPYGMNYSEIIPVLVKAVQEQQQTINELKHQNEIMAGEIKQLQHK
jgi:hypothetical protein